MLLPGHHWGVIGAWRGGGVAMASVASRGDPPVPLASIVLSLLGAHLPGTLKEGARTPSSGMGLGPLGCVLWCMQEGPLGLGPFCRPGLLDSWNGISGLACPGLGFVKACG